MIFPSADPNHMSLARSAARIIPRGVRNFIRAPRRTLRWWWLNQQPDIEYSPRPEIRFQCPRVAVEGAFNLIESDLPQVVEFDEFLQEIRRHDNPILFDIGAHFGIFSFGLLATRGPASRAVALDPSPAACRMVRHIRDGNGWGSRLCLLQAAAGAEKGELEMVDAGIASSGYFVLPGDHPEKDRIKVPIRTINDLVGEFGVPHYIKIDVESFEGDVIAGGEETLLKERITLFIELHNRMATDRGADPRQPLRLLRSLGYSQISLQGKPLSDDELLMHELIRVIARKD